MTRIAPAALAGALALAAPTAQGAQRSTVAASRMGPMVAGTARIRIPAGDLPSANWVGHVAVAPSGTGYTVVTAETSVPTAAPSADENEEVGGWVGLGSASIIQAGWGIEVPPTGPPYYYAWWEDLPKAQVPVPTGDFQPLPGHDVAVTVHYLGNGTSDFTFKDMTTGKSWSTGAKSTPDVDESTADFIVENPLFRTAEVPDFRPVLFQAAYYGPSPSQEYPLTGGPVGDNTGNDTFVMTTTPGASPTAVSNAEFTVNYDPNGG